MYINVYDNIRIPITPKLKYTSDFQLFRFLFFNEGFKTLNIRKRNFLVKFSSKLLHVSYNIVT